MTQKKTTAAHRTLTIHRPHARLELNRLGYVLAVPQQAFPDAQPPTDGTPIEDALGWEVPAKYKGRVDLIEPVGFTAPSPWEIRYIEYVARTLDVPVADNWPITESAEPPRDWQQDLLHRIERTRPWASAAEIPQGVRLLRAETSRLEARQMAFLLKDWLVENGGIDACRRALILLPHGRGVMDIWLDELQIAGIPALGVRPVLLSETPLANWIVRAAELAGWDEETAVSRTVLREAFDSDFWSARTADYSGGSIRKDLLREALLSLRRPMITFNQWLAHLEAMRRDAHQRKKDNRAEGYTALIEYSRQLIAAFKPGSDQVSRLKELLYRRPAKGLVSWRIDAVARGTNAPEAIAVATRLRNELERLQREEHAAGGNHPELTEDPPQTIASLLKGYIRSTALVDRHEPQCGIQLLPYELYDGRPVEFLMMAGLSETGFPRAPEILTRGQESWLGAMGIMPKEGGIPGQDIATRWIGLEMERQLSLATTAISRCVGQLTLSFSLQGAGDEVVHPGGLLSLLAGGWSDDNWQHASDRVVDLSWPDEVPRHPAAARNLDEARYFALHDEKLRVHLLDAVGAGAAEKLRCDDATVGALQWARQIDREIWAAPGDAPRPAGPHSGRLPGGIVPPESYSASSLEAYGECPYKYFLSKTLGLSVPKEKSNTPEDNEVGTLLHDSLAAAADRAISAAADAVWSLSYDPSCMDLTQLVEERLAEVRVAVELAFEEFCVGNPTISRTYVECLKVRWLQAVKKWLKNHLEEHRVTPLTLDEASILESPYVREKAKPFENLQAKISNTRAGLSHLEARIGSIEPGTKTKTVDAFRAVLGSPILPTKNAIEKIVGAWLGERKAGVPEADHNAITKIRHISDFEEADRKLVERRIEMEKRIDKEREHRLRAVDARVVYAERAFGMGKDHPDPAIVELDQRSICLKGQIDRIDRDHRRNVLAVRDYKTGKEISQRKLIEESADGIKLQLLLYSIAVEEMVRAGMIDLPQDAPIKQVSLEFLREGKVRYLNFMAEEGSGYLLDEKQASWIELGRAWLASHTEGIAGGRFEIAPAKCPKVDYAGSFCDYKWYCPYTPGMSPAYEKNPAPPIALDVSGPDDDEVAPTPPPPPILVPLAQNAEDKPGQLQEAHAAGQHSAQNVKQNVLIAAGAGTGKTYNLVLRYLAALAGDAIDPNAILCVTFTRKAAAQMRHRVRQALFRPDGDEQKAFADKLRSDERRFRSLVLSLSGAPISTIDALAARIVEEGEEILEATGGVPRTGLREGLSDAMQEDLTRSFVAQKFTDELEQGNADLKHLVDCISIHKLKEKMVDLVSGALPDWASGDSTHALVMQTILYLWSDLNVAFGPRTKQETINSWADTAARALLIAREWRVELIEDLWGSGNPRYSDITERANKMLGDPNLAPHFKERLGVSHLFVDESQDTSESQIQLISTIAELTGAKLFWVGDIKQSIYRFRGAEVDVFEKLVESGDTATLERGSLRVNRRSSRRLIDAFNSLFSGLLPALHDDQRPIDPGSEIAYEPLAHWREDDDDDSPAIELIAVPGKNWPLNPDLPERDALIEEAEKALVTRIGEFVQDKSDSHSDGPEVAVLVHAWWRAYHYQYVLQAAGIRAAVQGGGGLLRAPEAISLLHWLAAAVEKSDTAVAAMLKGPGIRMSDAGLYCLSRGMGVKYTGQIKENLRNAAFHGEFDPAVATEMWSELDPSIVHEDLLTVLSEDYLALQRFRKAWESTFARCGFQRTSELFSILIQELDLEAYWFAVPGRGRQAVANLAAFLDLVRSTEQSGGTPMALLRALVNMNDKDQPRATGIDAGVNADVVITTHWQAKGLEWPVVVLPDIQKTDSKNGDRGILPDRLLVPEGTAAFAPKSPLWFVGCHVTTDSSPLDYKAVEVIGDVRKKYLGPANRAETRRLLYVAMTRAKRKLLISGSFDAPAENKCSHKVSDTVSAYSLDIGDNWGLILQVCLGLGFDKDGTPRAGEDSLLTPEQIRLTAPQQVQAADKEKTEALEDTGRIPEQSRVELWLPLHSEPRLQVSPSEVDRVDAAPQPLVAPAWPARESSRKSVFGTMDHEGAAFHQVMESWAFGGSSGEPLNRELVRGVLEDMGIGDSNGAAPRVNRIVELYELSCRAVPELFDTLTAAALRSDLYPEIPVRYEDGPGRLVDGIVDLVWRDDAGWHVLDYKAGWQHPHKDSNLDHPKLRQHFAQTAMYTRGLQKLLPGEVIADFGVWYVAAGLVVRWDAAEAQEA